ncbi:hypothetical protein Tco_0581104 [Tanacetum coccineum]
MDLEADGSLAKHKALEFEIEHLLRAFVSQDIMSIVQSNSGVDTSNHQTELEHTKERIDNCIIKKENEYAKLWNDCSTPSGIPLRCYDFGGVTIEQFQAQLGDQKGKSKDTLCVSDTLDPLSQKLENENVELEFQVVEMNDLSNPITSNSVPTPQESKVMKNDNMIAPGMFRINPFQTSKEEKVDNTAKTRRPQPRSNIKNDRIPSASKSSRTKNKEVEVEEHHRKLLLSKNKKHMSSECNNIKLVIRNDKSEVICAMCKQCLITANHDVCVLNYVNDMNSRDANQSENVSNVANQKKHKPKVKKSKKLGSKERLDSPMHSKPRSCLRWSPTRRSFDLKGKIIASSESECQSNCSNGYLNFFMVRRLGMLKAYDRKSEASHKFCLEVLGNHPL